MVELESALGRSTLAMVEGLSRNAAATGSSVHVYDLMRFDWFLQQEYPKWFPNGPAYEIGDSFEHLFWHYLEQHRDRVRLHAGDICQQRWEGGPIEFLFVDIMKTWAIAEVVIREFYPSLIPGRSLIVHQDYKHPFAPQVLLTMFRLRDAFDPVWSITGNGCSASVAFRLTRPLSREELRDMTGAGLTDLRSYRIGELDDAIDYALAIVAGDPPEEVGLVQAARSVALLDLMVARPEFVRAGSAYEAVRALALDRIRPFVEAEKEARKAARAGRNVLRQLARNRFGRWLRSLSRRSRSDAGCF
ncbi:MAG: hypothetical protein U0X73_13055 [Thermoanaerobaculia bacterium]